MVHPTRLAPGVGLISSFGNTALYTIFTISLIRLYTAGLDFFVEGKICSRERGWNGMTQCTETSLLSGLRARDEKTFEQLVERYSSRLFSVTHRLLQNEDDARDAVQDTFVSAFRSIDTFAGQAQFSTWLHRIACNAALMKLRTQRRRREDLFDTEADNNWQEAQALQDSIDQLLHRQEIRTMVHACIAELPDTYRTVVLLRDIEELNTTETAHRLGTSPTAVKLRLHRARKALRVLLKTRFSEQASELAYSSSPSPVASLSA